MSEHPHQTGNIKETNAESQGESVPQEASPDWLAEIESQLDDTVPYYVPRLLAECVTLRAERDDLKTRERYFQDGHFVTHARAEQAEAEQERLKATADRFESIAGGECAARREAEAEIERLKAERDEAQKAAAIWRDRLASKMAANESLVERVRGLEWQPIETAPRDKRVVLLYGCEFGRRIWGRGYYFKGVPGDGEGWVTSSFYTEPEDDSRGIFTPTHWMPMPSVDALLSSVSEQKLLRAKDLAGAYPNITEGKTLTEHMNDLRGEPYEGSTPVSEQKEEQ